MIDKRKKEVEKLLPPPPTKYKFKAIRKGQKGKKGDLVIRDSDSEEEGLPEIFFNFCGPSKHDLKVVRAIKMQNKRITIPIFKNITINNTKVKNKYKNTTFIVNKT